MLFGDWLAGTFEKLGVPACFQCKARQERLNQMHLKIKSFLDSVLSGSSGSSSSHTSDS